jgi:hypothetical protein
MGFTRSSILLQLLQPKLSLEIDGALSVVRQGFDVVVRVRDADVREVFKELMRGVSSTCEFRLGESFFCFEEFERFGGREKPFLLISDEALPEGSGFVSLELPGVEALLPSLAAIVTTVLKYFNQEELMDVFDGKNKNLIREVLVRKGISAAVDAIVRISFHVGIEGDNNAGERIADEILTLSSGNGIRADIPCESLADLASRFFRVMLSKEGNPHVFIKSALSWFVVNGMGHSVSEASRVLNISRSTLQDHLRVARIHGVDRFFSTAIEPTLIQESFG